MASADQDRFDPTGGLKWEQKYLQAVVPLIDTFGKRVVEDLEHAWETGKIKALESGKFSPSTFYPHIDDLAEQEIVGPSQKIVDKTVPKAYDQGQVYASIQLGAPPEERRRQWTKIKTLLEDNKNEFKGESDEAARRIKRIVGDGIVNEKTQRQIIKDIQAEVEMSKTRATRIVRTETMRAVNTGVKDRYVRGGVEYVKWLACGDDRTCDRCADLDGKIFPIDEVPEAPLHPGCRCTYTPVVRPPKEEPAPEPAAMNGEQVREKTLGIARKTDKERTALEQQLAKAKGDMQTLSNKHAQYMGNYWTAKASGDKDKIAYWMKEVQAAGKECDQAIKASLDIQKQIDVVRGKQAKAIHESVLFLRKNPVVNYDVKKGSALYKNNRGALDDGFEFFGRVVGDEKMWADPVKVNGIRAQRAYMKDGEIFLSSRSDTKTITHELAHIMEDRSKGVLAAEKAFYQTRTKGDPLIPLSKATGVHGYRANEVTRKDTFPDAYCGKDYGGKNYEVLSMGTEWLQSDPVWFAKTDPEYFDWTVNTLRGVL